MGSSSLTRDRTSFGNVESYPLDYQGSPWGKFLQNICHSLSADNKLAREGNKTKMKWILLQKVSQMVKHKGTDQVLQGKVRTIP